MKQGKTLQGLAEELTRQLNSKHDFLADTHSIRMAEDGKTITVADKPEELNQSEFERLMAQPVKSPLIYFSGEATHHCHRQIASRLHIPFQYYQQMQEKAPDLLAANVNRWFKQEPERRLVRTLDNRARAFLSDRYRPLDNYDLAQAVLPKIRQMDCEVKSCEVTEARMYIKAVTERITAEVSKDDVVQAGIVVSNSETGLGTLKVEPLVFRLVCLNGMISGDSSLRKYHIGRSEGNGVDGAAEFYRDETRKQDDKAFWMKVQDTVGAALDEIQFEKIVSKMQFAKDLKFDAKPQHVVELMSQREGMNEKEQTNILDHLISGGDLSAYGLANAITRASHDVKSYDKATDFERLGGKVIELNQQQWTNFQKGAA